MGISTLDFILCANDFGHSEPVSSAILHLFTQQRVNAVSCMVNMPFWQDAHHELDNVNSAQFIGLHLNLTSGQPLSAAWRRCYGDTFFSLSKLIQYAYRRKLDKAVIRAEIQAQLDLFMQDIHIYPDFIQGYQHIQQLPVISDVLLDLYQEQQAKIHGFSVTDIFEVHTDPDPVPCFLGKTSSIWHKGWRGGWDKNQILALVGARAWHQKLIAANIATNTSFGGVYRRKEAQSYRRYFQGFLSQVQDGGLIVCHPGFEDCESDSFRQFEFKYLESDDFLADLQAHSVQFLEKT